jgi:hypothetical protein
MGGVWLQGRPFWHDYRAIGMEAGDPAFGNVILDVASLKDRLTHRPDGFTSRPLVFIVHPSDAVALALLERRFPQGQPRRHPGPTERRGFVLFVVPRE